MKGKAVLIVLLVVLCGAGGYWGYLQYKGEPVQGLQATGTIEATQVQVTAKLPGTLRDITVGAGDQVKKGQLIATVVRNDIVAQKERDALGVLIARAKLDDLLSGARQQEIKEAEIAVSTAVTRLEQATRDYERAVALQEAKAISQADLEKASLACKLAQSQLDSSRTRLDLLQSGSRSGQIEAARAELERNNAVLKASEALLEDTRIICPLDGVVLSRNYEEGEFIQAGAPVATVADLAEMWIKVYIPTDDLPRVKLGQGVVFSVSGSTVAYSGTVEEIATQGEYTPKMIQTKKERTNIVYAVKIGINDENGVLKPGMPADVIIH
ncbi:MAG: Macrolide export protein MacA [Firmicutes bacterium ADurb.Bin456]|nr:MAG: Macrolide export protein MacA [Firmicutes bacterium ADurb.Bin456]